MGILAAVNSVYWHEFFFMLFAGISVVFAVCVLLTQNIVRMAFYLVLSLGSTAGLFFLAGAEFVGAMQLMIYVGGTLVLLIFGVMLTAQQRYVKMNTHPTDWVLATIVGGSLLVLLIGAAAGVDSWKDASASKKALAELDVDDARTATPLGLALTGVRVDKLDSDDPALANGQSGYLLPFIIVSVHLLVVLIGAAYMARTKRSATAPVGRAERARLNIMQMEHETDDVVYSASKRSSSSLLNSDQNQAEESTDEAEE